MKINGTLLVVAFLCLFGILMYFENSSTPTPEPTVDTPLLFDPTELQVQVRELTQRIGALENELDGTELPSDHLQDFNALKETFLLYRSDDWNISREALQTTKAIEAWLDPAWATDPEATREKFLTLAQEIGDQKLNNEIMAYLGGEPQSVFTQLLYLFMRGLSK